MVNWAMKCFSSVARRCDALERRIYNKEGDFQVNRHRGGQINQVRAFFLDAGGPPSLDNNRLRELSGDSIPRPVKAASNCSNLDF